MAAPVLAGALDSTEIGREHWAPFAAGAALGGVTVVCGENVCGADPKLQVDSQGRIAVAPDMDRRIESYRRYHRGLGEILVRMNVGDARLGVAEYLLDKHGLETIELSWGQGGEGGGEVKTGSLERALEWKKRGCVVLPDPANPLIQAAFHAGAFREFERHGKLGILDEGGFLAECERLRRLGFQRITLHVGTPGLRELAMAIKWGSRANIDLVTIGGGDSDIHSERRAATWGVPALHLHSAAANFADRLAAKGERVPDLAFAGDFSAAEHVFKALALSAPHGKAVCIGPALMLSSMAGTSTGSWVARGGSHAHIGRHGEMPEQDHVYWEQVAAILGRDEMKRLPSGAADVFSLVRKLSSGLRQIMAGAGCTSISAISRRALMSLTRDCADVTGIPYVMDAYRAEAEAVLES